MTCSDCGRRMVYDTSPNSEPLLCVVCLSSPRPPLTAESAAPSPPPKGGPPTAKEGPVLTEVRRRHAIALDNVAYAYGPHDATRATYWQAQKDALSDLGEWLKENEPSIEGAREEGRRLLEDVADLLDWFVRHTEAEASARLTSGRQLGEAIRVRDSLLPGLRALLEKP